MIIFKSISHVFLAFALATILLTSNIVNGAVLKTTSRSAVCPVILPQHQPMPPSRMLRPGTSRIINGDSTLMPLSDYFCIIYKADNSTCTGTIIAPNLVVTSAICAQNVSIVQASADNSLNGENITISKVIHDNRFDTASAPNSYSYNFAILELSQNVPTTNYMRVSVNADLPSENSIVRVVGNGDIQHNGQGNFYRTLNQVDLPATSHAKCEEFYESNGMPFNSTTQVCAGYENRDCGVCTGDEGAPIIQYDSNDMPVIVGVLSTFVECATKGSPALFTKTAQYLSTFSMLGLELGTQLADMTDQRFEDSRAIPSPTQGLNIPVPSPSLMPTVSAMVSNIDFPPIEVSSTPAMSDVFPMASSSPSPQVSDVFPGSSSSPSPAVSDIFIPTTTPQESDVFVPTFSGVPVPSESDPVLPSSSPEVDGEDVSSTNLTPGVIGGIVAGAVVLLIIIILVVAFMRRRR